MIPTDFLRLLVNSKCLIGNSSVGIRECSFLGVPVVNVGSRQEGRERGANVVDVVCERAPLGQAIRERMENGHHSGEHLYGDGTAGAQIATLLAKSRLSIVKRLTY